LTVFDVGHATTLNPPVDPQPVTAEISVAAVKLMTIAVVTPVMVTVDALVQVLAPIADVPTVVVVLAMPLPPEALIV
jgi:hypothetical protein